MQFREFAQQDTYGTKCTNHFGIFPCVLPRATAPKVAVDTDNGAVTKTDAATVMSHIVAEPETRTRQVAAPRHATISRSHTYVWHAVIQDISSGCWVSPTHFSTAHWACLTQCLHLKRHMYDTLVIFFVVFPCSTCVKMAVKRDFAASEFSWALLKSTVLYTISSVVYDAKRGLDGPYMTRLLLLCYSRGPKADLLMLMHDIMWAKSLGTNGTNRCGKCAAQRRVPAILQMYWAGTYWHNRGTTTVIAYLTLTPHLDELRPSATFHGASELVRLGFSHALHASARDVSPEQIMVGNAGRSPQDLAALGALQDSFLPSIAAQGGGRHASERT